MSDCSTAIKEIVSPAETEEKPENGLKGLKHWRQDMLAGLVVALVSVPLSLGIAIASGAPPICGITSEIIAGLVFPFLGGAYVTVSGPAAGLAPVILSSMLQLGHGDTVLGYHRIVCVIMLVGVLQLIMTQLKAAKFSHLFPSAAIQGMLASIGLMLVMKQMPNMLGQKFQGHEFFEMAAEFPAKLAQTNWSIFALSAFCLVLLFGLNAIKSKWMRIIPPQLVVVVGAALGAAINIDPKFLVHAPSNPFEHGFMMPDFPALFADHSIWVRRSAA